MANSDLNRPHVFEPGVNNTVLLLLHGTGADEHDLLGLGRLLDKDAALLSPRGMHLEAGMNRFFERFPDGSFNEESINVAVEGLANFLDAATSQYNLVGKRFVAVGFSNGANTATALLIRRPGYLSGVVAFGSTKPFKAVEKLDLTGKHFWLANGDQDPYAPLAISEKWVQELTDYGAEVRFMRHAGGHQISPDHVSQISRQLAAAF